MGVYKREYGNKGKPIWYYQFRYRKSKYAEAGFSTEREGKDAERKKRLELTSKRTRPIPKVKATVSDYMPKFLAHREITKSGGTVERERRKARVITGHFGVRRIDDISIGDIHEFVAMRKKQGRANRTINLELTLLRSIFKYAMDCNVTDRNPAREVTNLREVQTEKWVPTKEEFLRFVDAAKTTTTATCLVPWLWFRAYTGTRPSESFHIEWEDIDFDSDRIYIRPKNGHELKNAKFRVVDMHPELKPILLAWRQDWEEIHGRWLRRERVETIRKDRGAKPDHQWVFINPGDHGSRAQGYHRSFYDARKKAGLPKMASHTLRHYFISQCVMSGIDFFTIAKWVGHSNSRMIEEVYGHLSPGYRREQMAKLSVVPVESII